MRDRRTTAIDVLSLLGVVGALAYCGSNDTGDANTAGDGAPPSRTGGSGGTLGLTGSTSGTGINATPGTGGTGGTGTSDLTPDAACAVQASESTALPSDVFIMLDVSGSMSCPTSDDTCELPPPFFNPIMHPTRWEAVTMAINSFNMAPGNNGVGVGIGFFPVPARDDCDVNAYATPSVPIAPLPGSAMAIQRAIAPTATGSDTPTTPALAGAIQYARKYTMSTPGRTASVVFVTDGLPNGCGSTIPEAVMAAKDGYDGTPQVKTYVVGIGPTGNLDQLALGGSGGATRYFPATGDVAGRLAAALTTISHEVSCDYTIPKTAVDPKNVNVQIAQGGGAKSFVTYVGTADKCTSGGWYYDNPTTPTKITLCSQTCDPLKATMGSSVQVLYGCPTNHPPIN